MTQLCCAVNQLEPLTPHVTRVLLKPEHTVAFKPGQYLWLHLSPDDKRAFSIANGPRQDNLLELHIGASGPESYAQEVIEFLQANQQICVTAPEGEAWLREQDERPILIVAGGSGFSYAKSLLDALLQKPRTQPVWLYWGVRSEQDIYGVDELRDLQRAHDWFKFAPVVEMPDEFWVGRVGRVLDQVKNDLEQLADFDIYAAGRFDMVKIAKAQFMAQGAQERNMYADAFAFI